MGLTFSSRAERPVPHQVQYRTKQKTTDIPGVTNDTYEKQEGYVSILPTNQTLDNLRKIFLDQFGIEPRVKHHFALVYCFGQIKEDTRTWNILAGTDLRELLENPLVSFVFSYLPYDPQLLE
jgi:hypothetical protein